MKVIIATDGSNFSRAAVKKFCELMPEPANAKIKVLSVYEKLAPMATEPFAVSADYYREIENTMQKQSEGYVDDAALRIRERFPNAEIEVVTDTVRGSPGRSIVETAKEWGADLIVVGSHGHDFWNRMMLGSVSDAVVHHAPCSVLVVREAARPNGNARS